MNGAAKWTCGLVDEIRTISLAEQKKRLPLLNSFLLSFAIPTKTLHTPVFLLRPVPVASIQYVDIKNLIKHEDV